MKAFLLVFDQSRIDRETVLRQIDKMHEIANWYALFGNTMCIASDLDSRSLSRLIRDAFPGLRFIVSEVDPQHKGGWLPKPVWSFLNDPDAVETEPA